MWSKYKRYIIAVFLAAIICVSAGANASAGTLINAATLTYGDESIDVYKNSYTVSIDDNKTLKFNFDVGSKVNTINLINLTEEGAKYRVCSTTTKECSFQSTDLKANTGLQIVLSDSNGNILEQTMLGLIIKQNEIKERYEGINVTMGPSAGRNIDMSDMSKGMSMTINPIPIPIKAERYPDGRTVLGIGGNASDAKFWEDAANDNFAERISKGDLYSKWKQEHSKQATGGSLGLVWAISGYATSYDDNPRVMTGTIQFYVGSGWSLTGQYSIFTFTVTVTYGANGEFVFTMVPDNERQPLQAELNLGASAGIELFGGIGNGYLASVGVYGAAKISTDFRYLPSFLMNSLKISGEVGLKAKVLGRDVFTFTFTRGEKEFIKGTKPDGTEYYYTDLNFAEAAQNERDRLIANNYGNQMYDPIEAPQGETTWNLTNIDQPTNLAQNLTTNSDGTTTGERSFAHQIAENVYPHSGMQVVKGHMNTLSAITVFANNSGELNYSIYDGFYGSMTEPQPVAGTGAQDFDAEFTRGQYSTQSYLVWKRLGTANQTRSTLTDIAQSGEIKIARFNYDSKSFVDYESVTDNSNEIYGDVTVTVYGGLDAKPYVFAYTNPSYDPAGLSDSSNHDILVFYKDNNEWKKEVIGSYQGIISSFSSGPYGGYGEAYNTAILTIEQNGNKRTVALGYNKNDHCGFEIRTIDGAWGARFTNDLEQPILIYMKDGKLYVSHYSGYDERIFGTDEAKLPEAPFSLIGDPIGTFAVAYLSSNGKQQNIVAYTSSGGSEAPITLTHVGELSNVSYFGGVFIGNNYAPFIVYTVQHYREWSYGGWEDTTADMFAQVADANNHVSLESAEVMNLNDLAVTTNQPKVSVLVKNDGLFNVKKLSFYLKNENQLDIKYVKLADVDISTLHPGEMMSYELTLPESDFTNPHSYVLGMTSRDDQYSSIGVQSDTLVRITEGPFKITEADYNFRDEKRDFYKVTVRSLGPGIKSGRLVFYNRGDLTEYYSEPINGLKPGEYFTATLDPGYTKMLSDYTKNLGVRVLKSNETLDDGQPTGRYRQTALLPSWFQPYLHEKAPKIDDAEHSSTPDTIPAGTKASTKKSKIKYLSGISAGRFGAFGAIAADDNLTTEDNEPKTAESKETNSENTVDTEDSAENSASNTEKNNSSEANFNIWPYIAAGAVATFMIIILVVAKQKKEN